MTTGLYIHIPYCAALCSYCDFAKTANHTVEVTQAYLRALQQHTSSWLAAPVLSPHLASGLSSVFLGGGTPSLFAAELAPLMDLVRPRLQLGAEVSLEANPDDLAPERLRIWRQIGVNRLSVGVQSFDPAALKILGRTHNAVMARDRIAAALGEFPNLNIDLIYGWPGQTMTSWRDDLRAAISLGIPHLSLYCLTFESRTVLGRKAERGLTLPPEDEQLALFYEAAREQLAEAGYDHEEVSNWSKPGFSCKHNWLYWQDRSFVGVGAGAHGYLGEANGIGVRYAYPRNDRQFGQKQESELCRTSVANLATQLGAVVDDTRDVEAWLTEVVGASLRTVRGFPLESSLQRTGHLFKPTPVTAAALDQGILRLSPQGMLTLSPAEWFREAGWSVEVLRSLVPA